MNAIATHQLSYTPSRTFSIPGLTLTVPAGAIYGFLGPNGSGKTTVIRLLLGMLHPAAGRITVLGEPVPARIPAVLARTGFVPERPHLYPTLTVSEAMRYHASFFPGWDARRADRLRRGFAVADDCPIGRLSKGEMGKLLLLLALSQTPELLILDEPTDGLDPVVRREVLSALLDYVAERRATVFISSHLVHELERICDWVGVMDRGRLVAELPMTAFKNGIKRLRVARAPAALGDLPFLLLARESVDGTMEHWLVRGWQSPMAGAIGGLGAELREVVDLDLEEGFVELLRTARAPGTEAV